MKKNYQLNNSLENKFSITHTIVCKIKISFNKKEKKIYERGGMLQFSYTRKN